MNKVHIGDVVELVNLRYVDILDHELARSLLGMRGVVASKATKRLVVSVATHMVTIRWKYEVRFGSESLYLTKYNLRKVG